MGSTVPLALSPLVFGGGFLLVAGAIWCFVFPAVQNQIGLEAGKWKATGLPTGAILVAAGVGLLSLDSRNSPPPKPQLAEVALATAEGQPSVEANVRCPFTVNLKGRISVTGGQGDVTYRFVRQGFNQPEAPTEVKHVRVDGPGSQQVHDSYTFNVPAGVLFVEDRLQVLKPEDLRSEPVQMRVRCDANLPPGPPEPPPDVPPAG
jgi:hypothetical protein